MVREDLEKLYSNHYLVADNILSFRQQIQIDFVLPNNIFLNFDHSILEHDELDQMQHGLKGLKLDFFYFQDFQFRWLSYRDGKCGIECFDIHTI